MILLIWQFWTAQAIIEVDPKTNKIRERDHTSLSKLKTYYTKGLNRKTNGKPRKDATEDVFEEYYSKLIERGKKCSANYPFAFDNGKKCCFSMREKRPDPGVSNSAVDSPNPCNGGELLYSSTCCFNDNYEECPGDECYSNTEYIRKRMQTRMVPYEGSTRIQLDAIDIEQKQCRTNASDENSACSKDQECLFSQRDDVANGRWGCYDVECPFETPYRFGATFDANGNENEVTNDLNRPGKTNNCCFTREFYKETEGDGTPEGQWICRNNHKRPCKRRHTNFGEPEVDALCATNELAVSFKLNTLETVIDEDAAECGGSCPVGQTCLLKIRPDSGDTEDTGFRCGFNISLRRGISITMTTLALILYPSIVTFWFVFRAKANAIYQGYEYLVEHSMKYKIRESEKRAAQEKKSGCLDSLKSKLGCSSEVEDEKVADIDIQQQIPRQSAIVNRASALPKLAPIMEGLNLVGERVYKKGDAQLDSLSEESDEPNFDDLTPQTMATLVITDKPVDITKIDSPNINWTDGVTTDDSVKIPPSRQMAVLKVPLNDVVGSKPTKSKMITKAVDVTEVDQAEWTEDSDTPQSVLTKVSSADTLTQHLSQLQDENLSITSLSGDDQEINVTKASESTLILTNKAVDTSPAVLNTLSWTETDTSGK